MLKRIIGSVVVALSLVAGLESSYAAEAIGRVTWVKGTLTASNNGVRNLAKNASIYQNDELTTGAGSLAGLAFTDNTLMTLKEGTHFSVKNYNFNKKTQHGHFIGDLITGGFRTITGLISKHNPESYSVNTPVALIGVRGTDYQAVLKNGALYVEDFSGTPCLTNSYSEGQPAPNTASTITNWVTQPAVRLPQVLVIAENINQERRVCSSPAVIGTLSNLITRGLFPVPLNIPTASAFSGAGLTFSAIGLPAGLSINPITGVITGTIAVTPVTTVYTITVVASNACGAVSTSFELTVTDPS